MQSNRSLVDELLGAPVSEIAESTVIPPRYTPSTRITALAQDIDFGPDVTYGLRLSTYKKSMIEWPPARSDQVCLEEPVSVPTTDPSYFLVVALFSLLFFVTGINENIIGDASADIIERFNAANKLPWLSCIGVLAKANFVLIAGRIDHEFDSKYILVSCGMTFMVAQVLAGTASSLDMLLLGRALAGAASAFMTVCAVSTTARVTTTSGRVSTSLACIFCSYTVALKAAPFISGTLSQLQLWRWIFFIQIPPAFALTLGMFLIIPRRETNTSKGTWTRLCELNYASFILQAVFVSTFILPLALGGNLCSWTSFGMVICYLAAPLSLGLLLVIDYYTEPARQILPLEEMCRDRTFICMGLLSAGVFAVLSATLFYLPVFFQLVYGQSPIMAAVWLLPSLIAGLFVNLVINFLLLKFRYYTPLCIVLSFLGAVAGLQMSWLSLDSSVTQVCFSSALLGVAVGGMGAIAEPVLLALCLPSRSGIITSFVTISSTVGSAIGLSLTGNLISNVVSEATKADAGARLAHLYGFRLGAMVWVGSSVICLLASLTCPHKALSSKFSDSFAPPTNADLEAPKSPEVVVETAVEVAVETVSVRISPKVPTFHEHEPSPVYTTFF